MANKSKTNEYLLFLPNRKKYNPHSIESILAYASKLEGLSFEDILYQNGLSEDKIDYLRNQSMTNKGMLGILIEEAWFGYPANSKQEADFGETGVELKSTPYEGEGSKIRPGETLSLTQINYAAPQEENFYKSHVWEKLQKILIVYYRRQKEIADQRRSKLFYPINYVFMLRPDKKDLAIIEADYKLLTGYMLRGQADKLSRTHGMYLGVAPKSRKKEYVKQYYGNHVPALKRGFVLKIPYLTYVLHRAAGIMEDTGGTIIKNISEIQEKPFVEIIKERLNKYIGMERFKIWEEVKRPDEVKYPSSKNEDAILSCRMLGVPNNRVEELLKAGILPKIIRFREKKKDNQHFRIEDISFQRLALEESDYSETHADGNGRTSCDGLKNDGGYLLLDDYERSGWEASELYGLLADRQYLLMVFWDTEKGRIFKGCQIWGMPDKDLEVVHKAWNKTKQILDKGVKFTFKRNKSGTVVENNLPGVADNGVFHIRNHSSHSYYVIDGIHYGNGKLSDTDLLPNGDRISKQAYWLNRKYIESQLNPELVKKY